MLFSRMSRTFLPQQLLQEVILVNLLVSRSLNLLYYAVIKLSFELHAFIFMKSFGFLAVTQPISHLQIVKFMLLVIKSLGFELLSRIISANYTYFEISAKAFKSQAIFLYHTATEWRAFSRHQFQQKSVFSQNKDICFYSSGKIFNSSQFLVSHKGACQVAS